MSALWTATDHPATGSAASATKAANSSNGPETLRCSNISVSLSADDGETGIVQVSLKDGATVIWEATIHAEADSSKTIDLTNLDLRAVIGNDLTLEFDDAPDTGCQAAVSMSGDLVRSGANYGV